jgi:hypothetical protein
MLRWRELAAAAALVAGIRAQVAEPNLPRPGTIIVADLSGTATALNGDQRKSLKQDDRLRVGGTVTTERRSIATLLFSNGASVQIGPETELEVEEFGQAPVSGNPKYAELKEEPTISRTRLRLAHGDVHATVKPLKTARGSTFTLTLIAGTLRIREGTFRAMVRMSELGLGVCNLELQNGAADFEPLGGKFAPLVAGKKLAFAIEQDKATGAVKLGEMPKETSATKK